jgi:dienelactone hydrolase
MSEVLLFHHALGLTVGIREIADALRAAGHTVHLPDLYDGRLFTDLEQGVRHAESIGFDRIRVEGAAYAAGLPDRVVLIGFSLGVLPAQWLAQTRTGAAGAVLCHNDIPPEMLGSPWPVGVPLQMHTKEIDPWGDPEVCRAMARDIADSELHLYSGTGHLFAEPAAPDYDAAAAALLLERTLRFLARVR